MEDGRPVLLIRMLSLINTCKHFRNHNLMTSLMYQLDHKVSMFDI
jgi:hypothetical protein